MCQRQTLANLLRNCAKKSSLDKGLQTHGLVLRFGFEADLMLNNDLIDMYGKCGRTRLAKAVFDKMPDRNVVTWTALMCGHLRKGNAGNCLSLFHRMGASDEKPNEFTFSTSLKACSVLGDAKNGMQIHGLCAKSGHEFVLVVGNTIVDMYAKCGRIAEAVKMFHVMPSRNLVTWNVMIAAYALEKSGKNALILFCEMQDRGEVPDEFTFSSTLKACTGLGAVGQGSQIHASLITRGFWGRAQGGVAGALVDFYSKCNQLFTARKVFEQIEGGNVVCWSSLILGYAQDGNLDEAVDLFRKLQRSLPDQIDGFVLSSLVGVFADLALVEQGKQIHALTAKIPSGLDVSVANSILDMYLKCGSLHESERVFNEIPNKNVITWTSMITGYGKYGLGREAIEIFNKMGSDNLEPDNITYLAVLTACSHAGLIDKGREIFMMLRGDRRVKPRIEHYACMVDLLGRAGQLQEAKDLIKEMPLKANAAIWQTLLSGCIVHGDLEMGRDVGEILLRLDSDNTVNYVMLSNLYADSGYWKECEGLRKLARTKGLKKDAGRSWVEIDKVVHCFYNRDESHPLIGEIRRVLEDAERRMKSETGYIPGVRFALHDVEEETKEEMLRVHSEKLAIGLALVCGGVEEKRTVRVFKNLRVCGDCHAFIKGLSQVFKMVFLVRDANRFHKFEGGLCSCGDYW